MEQPLEVLELFSGIGGWAHALARLPEPRARISAAFDSHEGANACYAATLGLCPVATDLACRPVRGGPNRVWLLSPPCQPFTSGGLRRDAEDPRSAALLRLIDVVASGDGPALLALENVPPFRGSACRARLVAALEGTGYCWAEYECSPEAFGVPNRRMRYYLVASRAPRSFPATLAPSSSAPPPLLPSLREFLGPTLLADEDDGVPVPDAWLARAGFRFHAVSLDEPDTVTQCLTKAYFDSWNSGGSYVRRDVARATAVCANEGVAAMRLRFLSPSECLRLMGFPPSVVLPVPLKTQYRLIGNSVNVVVAARVLEILFEK